MFKEFFRYHPSFNLTSWHPDQDLILTCAKFIHPKKEALSIGNPNHLPEIHLAIAHQLSTDILSQNSLNVCRYQNATDHRAIIADQIPLKSIHPHHATMILVHLLKNSLKDKVNPNLICNTEGILQSEDGPIYSIPLTKNDNLYLILDKNTDTFRFEIGNKHEDSNKNPRPETNKPSMTIEELAIHTLKHLIQTQQPINEISISELGYTLSYIQYVLKVSFTQFMDVFNKLPQSFYTQIHNALSDNNPHVIHQFHQGQFYLAIPKFKDQRLSTFEIYLPQTVPPQPSSAS